MSKRFLSLVFILFFIQSSDAQPLSVYTDVQNQVMVWDNGVIRKVDYLQPIDMKVGRIAIPYIDNSNNFKVYYKGGSRKLNTGFTNDYQSSDCLISFRNATSLNVFDRGEVKNLSRLCNKYYAGDSLIVYMDERTQQFNAYYNGEIKPVEPFLADANNGIEQIEVKSNIAAYINYANQFHLFYHGAVVNQEAYPVSSFKAGRNTVAYIDAGNQFKVFYDGTTQILESFPPQTYSVGHNMVAYITVDGNFNIFCKGKVYKMGYFKPNFQVSDFVCLYQDVSGYSKVFQDGVTTTLEPYMPDKFLAQYNSVAYFDRNNVLKLYSNGEINEVTSALSPGQNNWSLNYDVVMYQVGNNFFKFYYEGREY
ncbi:MAG TPA: hypothetical protein VL092_02420 [Chitinophagaceae bacterium]|nr:hypothetical protein [Chitinophagaceae bacterium]